MAGTRGIDGAGGPGHLPIARRLENESNSPLQGPHQSEPRGAIHSAGCPVISAIRAKSPS